MTFTSHFIRGLRRSGAIVKLWKVKDTDDDRLRDFGYGLQYQNIMIEEAIQLQGLKIILAYQKNSADTVNDLLAADSHIIIHDPTELRPGIMDALDDAKQIYVIRKANLEHLPQAHFFPHPYERQSLIFSHERSVLAVSTSRIDFDKNTIMLLDANRLLPEDKRIKIYGFENRIYTRFKVVPDYPEWEQSKCKYPREHDAASKILRDAKYMVDMTVIKGDGGGTQYTTLEAIDVGTIPVLHEEWIMPGGEMKPGINCIVASTGEELAKLLEQYRNSYNYYDAWETLLDRHDSVTVCSKLLIWMSEQGYV